VSPPAPAPGPANTLAPVVIFLTGGAWSIGYKAWGALLGLGLSAHGVLVASVDYRNFPQGDVADMTRDVHTAIAWVFRHAGEYGGDVRRVFLVGQSAGAHLGALAVMQNVEALLRGQKTSWTTAHLAGFVGISGCYDLPEAKQHFHDRGLPLWVFQRMMRSTTDEELARFSPARLVSSNVFAAHKKAFQKLMPAFLLVHGKGDKTVGWQASHEFAKVLQQAGVKVKARYYKSPCRHARHGTSLALVTTISSFVHRPW
jgi:prenylcysteine alpha-carboxyl methylesterase